MMFAYRVSLTAFIFGMVIALHYVNYTGILLALIYFCHAIIFILTKRKAYDITICKMENKLNRGEVKENGSRNTIVAGDKAWPLQK